MQFLIHALIKHRHPRVSCGVTLMRIPQYRLTPKEFLLRSPPLNCRGVAETTRNSAASTRGAGRHGGDLQNLDAKRESSIEVSEQRKPHHAR